LSAFASEVADRSGNECDVLAKHRQCPRNCSAHPQGNLLADPLYF